MRFLKKIMILLAFSKKEPMQHEMQSVSFYFSSDNECAFYISENCNACVYNTLLYVYIFLAIFIQAQVCSYDTQHYVWMYAPSLMACLLYFHDMPF